MHPRSKPRDRPAPAKRQLRQVPGSHKPSYRCSPLRGWATYGVGDHMSHYNVRLAISRSRSLKMTCRNSGAHDFADLDIVRPPVREPHVGARHNSCRGVQNRFGRPPQTIRNKTTPVPWRHTTNSLPSNQRPRRGCRPTEARVPEPPGLGELWEALPRMQKTQRTPSALAYVNPRLQRRSVCGIC